MEYINANEIDILSLLPQQPPFVMVEKLIHCDIDVTTTSSQVKKENIFVDNEHLSESGVLENIAQTCAVRMGYINKYFKHEPVKIGVIGAVRNLEFFRLPKIDEIIVTEINTLSEVFNMTLVNATVKVGDELIAAGDMKIAVMEDEISTENAVLSANTEITVRFSEVDSMNIVWHGSYVLYFEDAREAFGKKYGLAYLDIFGNGYYAPLIDLKFNFKKPLVYGDQARIEIVFKNSASAKLIFDYKIYNLKDNALVATGSSTQVFLDKDYQLQWTNPQFFEVWKRKWNLL